MAGEVWSNGTGQPPPDPASALELLQQARSQVEEIQRLNAQLLGALVASLNTPETGQQICNLTERLQQLAYQGDAAFGKAQELIHNARESTADGQALQDRSQEARDTAGQPESLEDVLTAVRDVSGLEIQCVTYQQKQSSLLEKLVPIPGIGSQDATEIQVIIEGVMRASVALLAEGRPEAITVAVYSTDETTDGKGAWGSSDHQLYRRISAVAMRALFHFQQQVKTGEERPIRAFLKLLLWLCSYRNLLSSRCSASGTFLAVDTATQHLMPPILRPFRVSMEELKAAASPLASSPAYHMHSAPGYML